MVFSFYYILGLGTIYKIRIDLNAISSTHKRLCVITGLFTAKVKAQDSSSRLNGSMRARVVFGLLTRVSSGVASGSGPLKRNGSCSSSKALTVCELLISVHCREGWVFLKGRLWQSCVTSRAREGV